MNRRSNFIQKDGSSKELINYCFPASARESGSQVKQPIGILGDDDDDWRRHLTGVVASPCSSMVRAFAL